MSRDNRQIRTILSDFKTRDDSEEPIIEGYFAVFNSNYEIFNGCTESIAPGAFSDTLSGDIRALIDHDTRLVIGRTNPKDSDAMNLHARVERGDVSQCSVGFNILDEEHEAREDGTHHFTIKKVRLFEVSCCTFPAYEETAISARKADIADYEKRAADVWRKNALKKLKEVNENA